MIDKLAPEYQTKDLHFANLLTRQGMSKDYVELLHDYSPRSRGREHTPYARFYRDRISGGKIMVAGLLPYVTHAGFFIVPRFRQVGSKFISEENCFHAEVDGGTIKVTCINDQPTGGKVNDQLIWRPQLFLNNVEQFSGNPIWLDTDPINSGYHFNTLEWDYGFCKRRVRIIEGRIRERWVFTANPNGEVRIKHNHTGALKLKMGEFEINDDEELVPASVFDGAEYPFEVMASPETFYPDPDAESTSVDGNVAHQSANDTWAAHQGGAGTHSYDSNADDYVAYIGWTQTGWGGLFRSIHLFDSSGLPDGAVVSAATFSVRGTSKADTLSITPDVNVYKSTPFANTALQNDDFVDVGTTALCATPITYGNWSVAGYNDFALTDVDTDDFGYISKTSITKLGMRNVNYDVANNEPTDGFGDFANCQLKAYFAEQGNTGSDPKLVVTYATPWGGTICGVSSPAAVNGVLVSNIAEVIGVA